MTTFIDGPAKGRTLLLRRSPKLLRVCVVGRDVDALDGLDDSPRQNERLVAYQRTAAFGRVFVDGRSFGGNYAVATYAMLPVQPADEVMRTNEAWKAWCMEMASSGNVNAL